MKPIILHFMMLSYLILNNANASSNFLSDPDFEDAYAEAGETFTDVLGSPLSTGSVWTRTTGSCDAWAGGPRNMLGYGIWGGLANGVPAVPDGGGNFAACGGWYAPGERISQTVNGVTPGVSYTLSFWYTHAGVEGETPLNFPARAGLWVDGVLIGATSSDPYLGAGNQVWKQASFEYTPTASSFQFTMGYYGTSVSDYGYIAFDGVSVKLPTTLTIIAAVKNDEGGIANINDLAVNIPVGSPVFDAGVTSGTTKTYTSTPITIDAGGYLLSSDVVNNYTASFWSCSGLGTLEFTNTASLSGGKVLADMMILDGDSITCTITYDDTAVCTTLNGDISQVSAAVPIQIASGDKVFVASSSPEPNKQGHFKAYAIQSNGSVSTTVSWDADDQMTSAERQARLFSTDSSGSKVLFNLLDDVAFNISVSDPAVTKIKEYTFNPSVDGGTYLSGRASGSFLGTLGQGNDVALLENRVNTWLYLDDSAYRTFASTLSSRSPKALVTSDDGFVYAFNQLDGDLVWGWMPRQLASELKNYNTFQGTRMMSGILDTLDFKLSGSYGSYVIGSYKEGLGQYTLKLDTSNGDALDAVVWDLDYSLVANGEFQTAPNQGEREYFKVNNDTYTAYIVSKNNLSTLVIKKLGDSTAATTVALNFHVTATPFVMPDFGNSLAPASRTLYLGAENGDIKRATLFNGSELEEADDIKTALEGTAVGALASSSEAITFIGASSAELGNSYYMRAQSEERLTILKYNTGTTNWDHIWTSYVTGAGTWDSSDSYTADTSGEPSDDDSDGFFTNVTATGIQSIPAGARITDTAQIVAGTVILPVSVPSDTNCFGHAYYYLYKLNAGSFPVGKFLELDHSLITGDIALGYGDPKRVEIADMSSNNQTVGFGNTDQKPDNTTGVTASFIINNNIITGIRGWKERTR